VGGVRLAADEDLFLRRDDLFEGGVSGYTADALGSVLGGLLDGHGRFQVVD
jgi:hypothetical protein